MEQYFMILKDIPTVEQISKLLPKIFPEGTENRNYVTREMCAKTIFVMLYTNSIEGNENKVRPDQITKMTDEQSLCLTLEERNQWYKDSLSRGKSLDLTNRWYAANTREPIRDETIRLGLLNLGAVKERKDLATTSSKPRYYLQKEFALLFIDIGNYNAIDNWREKFLSKAALARIKINTQRKISVSENHDILVSFPNGESRKMAPGPSSVLSKNVIETFATRFLEQPALIFLSESGNKVVSQDNELAISLGLKIEADRNLPDIIMADVGSDKAALIFIEVVATDGPINRNRKEALMKLVEEADFDKKRVLFLTAFQDRSSSVFKRLAPDIAWGSLVWFASEPDNILIYGDSNKYSVHNFVN